MDANLIDVHIAQDELALCPPENFLPPFVPTDLSTDSTSTTQFTSGGGPLCYSYAPMLGNSPPHEFQATPTAEGCGFFDDGSGLYRQASSQFLATPIPTPRISSDRPYDVPDVFESGPAGSFTRDCLAMSSVCQESPLAACRNADAASSQFMIPGLDRSLPSDTFHVSSVPTLSSHPQQMEQPLRCMAGLLEPSLTIGSMPWSDPIVKEETVSQRASPMRRRGDSQTGASKNRWKPNARQLHILEQHFRPGFTKATPELVHAVRELGPGTVSQVQVWLKNRLARNKRISSKLGELPSDESSTLDTDADNVTGNKRERQDEFLGDDFGSIQSAVLEELTTILESVDERDMSGLARAIHDANRVCCYGVNREGLALKAFTINLHNLGFKAYFVGDTNTPPLTTGDLFIVAAGPSYYSTVNALSLEAMRSGARVIAFTAHKTAPLPNVDCVIRIASQTLPPSMPVMNRKLGCVHADTVSSLPNGQFSVMQMGASFELALSLVLESLCIMLRRKFSISMEDMTTRTPNLY